MKIFILISALFFSFQYLFAQVKKTHNYSKISQADSIRIIHYLEKVNTCRLFSIKRQYYLDSVLVIVPWWAEMWQQKAMPSFKQRKYEIGMSYLDSAVKYDDQTHHFLEYRAFIKCIFQKTYNSSLIDFETLKKMHPNNYVMDHPYDFYISLCYLQLNNFDAAQTALKNCIESEQKTNNGRVNQLHWFYLGIIYYEKENYVKSLEYLNKCIEIYTNFSDAKYYKALCLEYLNLYSEAYKILIEAKNNFADGYTINQGNTPYERYPYQINQDSFKGFLETLKGKIK